MKKIILTIASMFVLSTASHSENWEIAAELDNNERILIDTDSYVIAEYDDKKEEYYIVAWSRISSARESAIVRIDIKECVTKQKGTMMVKDGDKKEFLFWDMNANKGYDILGSYMCKYAYNMLQEQIKNK